MRISDWSSDVCSSDLLHIPSLVKARDEFNMGQFSVEIYALPGSLLSGNQHLHCSKPDKQSISNRRADWLPIPDLHPCVHADPDRLHDSSRRLLRKGFRHTGGKVGADQGPLSSATLGREASRA